MCARKLQRVAFHYSALKRPMPTRASHRAHQPLTLFVLGSLAVHAAVFAALPPFGDLPSLPVVKWFEVTLRSPQPLPEVAPAQEVARPAAHAHAVHRPRTPAALPQARKPAEKAAARAAVTNAEVIAPGAARGEPEAKPVVTQPQAASVALAPAGRADASGAVRGEAKDTIAAIKPGDTVVPPTYHAAYLRNPPPHYPLAARLNGEQGTVLLKVLVTQQGLPGSVTVEKTSGSPLLDAAAVQTVRQWRFVPARRGEQAVDASVVVPIRFRLEDAS